MFLYALQHKDYKLWPRPSEASVLCLTNGLAKVTSSFHLSASTSNTLLLILTLVGIKAFCIGLRILNKGF